MKKGLLILLFLPSLVFSQEPFRLKSSKTSEDTKFKLKDFTKEPGYTKLSSSVDSISFPLYGYEMYMPTSTCGEIINYNNFSVSFCEEYRLPEWAIYYRNSSNSEHIYSRRGLNFKRDPNLKGRDADNGAYYMNPYDKGHLVPAADMNDNYESLKETFLFTNCVPQHERLNRGPMNQLEAKIRKWTIEFDNIAIITGWVVGDIKYYIYGKETISEKENNTLKKKTSTFSTSRYIPVPKYFYKVFIDTQRKRSIAFILPNEELTKPLLEYAVSIDYLESVTGLDFFYKLSDADELSFELSTGNKK
jgi:endonuclease G